MRKTSVVLWSVIGAFLFALGVSYTPDPGQAGTLKIRSTIKKNAKPIANFSNLLKAAENSGVSAENVELVATLTPNDLGVGRDWGTSYSEDYANDQVAHFSGLISYISIFGNTGLTNSYTLDDAYTSNQVWVSIPGAGERFAYARIDPRQDWTGSGYYNVEFVFSASGNADGGELLLKDQDGNEIGSVVIDSSSDSNYLYSTQAIEVNRQPSTTVDPQFFYVHSGSAGGGSIYLKQINLYRYTE